MQEKRLNLDKGDRREDGTGSSYPEQNSWSAVSGVCGPGELAPGEAHIP